MITADNMLPLLTQNNKRVSFKSAQPNKIEIQPDPLNKDKINITNIDTIGWVLSGGGAKGVFEVGVACALAKAGLIPDVILGTSVGALNAASFANGDINSAVDIWKSINKEKVYKTKIGKLISQTLGQIGNWFGLKTPVKLRNILDNTPLRSLIRQHTNYDELLNPDKAVQFMFGVTSLKDGKEALYATPQLYDKLKQQDDYKNGINQLYPITPETFEDAVIASTSIPIAFPPVETKDGLFVDGGTGNNTPAKNGIDALFAINKNLNEGLLFVVQLEPPDRKIDISYDNSDISKLGFRVLDITLANTAEEDIRFTQMITREIDNWLGLRGNISNGFATINKAGKDLQAKASELLKMANLIPDQKDAEKMKQLAEEISELGKGNTTNVAQITKLIQEYQPFNGKKKVRVVLIRPKERFGIDTLAFDKAGKNADKIIQTAYETTLNALLSTGLIDETKYTQYLSEKPYPVDKFRPKKSGQKLA